MIIPGIILTVPGLLLLVSFLFSRIRCTTATDAVIVRIIVKKHFFRGKTVKDCRPVFSYTVNDKKYTAKADFSVSDDKKYSVGQKLTVFIDAAHPENVRSSSNIGYGIAGLLLAAGGLFFIVLSFM